VDPLGAVLGALVAGAVVAVLGWRLAERRRVLERLHAEAPEAEAEGGREREGGLVRWLTLAGYRGQEAAPGFLAAQAACLALGGAIVAAVYASGVVALASDNLATLPGGFGGVFLPFVVAGPWIAFVTVALIPYLVVNAARRERVRLVEKDLPLTLELLATLGQAGLAFDAAVARLLDAQPAERPLFAAFRDYQRDLLGGMSRVDALRRIGDRLDVAPVTTFVASLIQAEVLGSTLAETLRQQSEDQRARRRAQVLIRAEALSVKLVFPLVICFMPGLFVLTLGPAFHQLFEVTDGLTRGVK